MLHQHRHFTKWRSAFPEFENVLSSVNSQNRGHSAIQQNLQERDLCFNKYFNLLCFSSKNKLGSSCVIYRHYSQQRGGGRPNFFSQFLENIKQEMGKNKEMKENLKKFREEAEKLEQSESLKKARAKYLAVEGEASAIKNKLGKVKTSFTGALEEARKSEFAKKAGKLSEELGKSARDAAESITAKGQKIGATGTFKTISHATAAVREELEQSGSQARVYVAPIKLRKRQEILESGTKIFDADTTTMDVELHKDSKFYESWQNFKNNNAYVNKILDWKIKFEESENPMIRMSRFVTDKLTYVVGGIFQNTELSNVLTEIVKIDPSFTKAKFLRQCETDIIPNILEAIIRGDLDILKDWCHEVPYKILSEPIKEVKARKGKFDSKILDIENLDLTTGMFMNQGPVLVITFTAQQILCIRDKDGNVIEGDPEKVLRVNYAWVLSRDTSELDPKAAWRLLDIAATSVQQLL